MLFRELAVSAALAVTGVATFLYFLTSINNSRGSTLGEDSVRQSAESTVVNSAFGSSLQPVYSAPVRLYSDAGHIDTLVEAIGLAEDGALGVPSGWYTAGWYKDGARPGAQGNVIIAAHYDTDYTGNGKGAFWGLKNLQTDDRVYIVDRFDKLHTYQVSEIFYLDISDSNRLRVFESTPGKSEITLITCGGVWLPERGTYNQRLIVKGVLL